MSPAAVGHDIKHAAQLLSDGQLVAIPTETVYGLAANAFDASAVARIFEAKNRPSFDPLIVHTHSIDQFQRLAKSLPDDVRRLARALCPGPLTFILPKGDLVPDIVTSGHATVGLRIPDHALTLDLLARLEFPLAAPSANPFGYVSPTTAQHVADQLGDRASYILDGGPCRVGLESTIIDFSIATPRILRLGGLSLERLEALVGHQLEVGPSSSNPSAPGMLETHYSPGTNIRVGSLTELAAEHEGERIGVLAFDKPLDDVDVDNQRVLSVRGNLVEAASNLFGYLRELDALGLDIVIAEPVPDEGLGRAINDRLRRAAARSEV